MGRGRLVTNGTVKCNRRSSRDDNKGQAMARFFVGLLDGDGFGGGVGVAVGVGAVDGLADGYGGVDLAGGAGGAVGGVEITLAGAVGEVHHAVRLKSPTAFWPPPPSVG
jgi:hypothetical protein